MGLVNMDGSCALPDGSEDAKTEEKPSVTFRLNEEESYWCTGYSISEYEKPDAAHGGALNCQLSEHFSFGGSAGFLKKPDAGDNATQTLMDSGLYCQARFCAGNICVSFNVPSCTQIMENIKNGIQSAPLDQNNQGQPQGGSLIWEQKF